jgi:hypothetical protein
LLRGHRSATLPSLNGLLKQELDLPVDTSEFIRSPGLQFTPEAWIDAKQE